MTYYLAYVNIFGFKAIIRKIAMITATASTLAAGVTKISLRRSTAVVTCICKHKINPSL